MAPIAVSDNAQVTHGEKLKEEVKVPAKVGPAGQEQLVINTIRCLAADLVQQYNGGHPGSVMGAAAIGVALWRYAMRYNPSNPDWFARDRFVLSAGHVCLLQYMLLHFSGYERWTFDEIKKYHEPSMDVIATGHPEIEYPGVEVTTGPLGQGIANAVGMAMAGKQVGEMYNKPGFPVVDGKIWCFAGDGCLQEGVGHESISMAGHFGLDNLILIYDNNAVTLDGSIDNCFTEDINMKFLACHWEVIDVFDGSNDLSAIVKALDAARAVKGRPVLVNIRTIIGYGSSKQNQGAAHGAALGDDDVAKLKQQLGFNPEEKFGIPSEVYEYFKECKPRGEELENSWNTLMAKYKTTYPKESAELERRMRGELTKGWDREIPTKDQLPQGSVPTRKASGIVLNALAPQEPSFVVGSADLLETTNLSFKGQTEYQRPDSGIGNYSGRQIRYGIREFAMVGVGNGFAAYHKGFFIPIMSTFFMFWLYAAPAARMGALQKLRWIGVATHDSICTGDNGPTHQPISLSTFYRSLPNINFFRPADAEEVVGAYLTALSDEDSPSLLSLSRDPLPLLPGTNREGVSKGAYIIHGVEEKPDITLLATGGEVHRAVKAAETISSKHGLKTRVVSFPSHKHFDAQPASYRQQVVPSKTSLVIAIEAWTSFGWSKYAHAGFHMQSFGRCAPEEVLYEHFGFGVDNLVKKIAEYAEKHRSPDGWDIPGVGEFEELLAGFV